MCFPERQCVFQKHNVCSGNTMCLWLGHRQSLARPKTEATTAAGDSLEPAVRVYVCCCMPGRASGDSLEPAVSVYVRCCMPVGPEHVPTHIDDITHIPFLASRESPMMTLRESPAESPMAIQTRRRASAAAFATQSLYNSFITRSDAIHSFLPPFFSEVRPTWNNSSVCWPAGVSWPRSLRRLFIAEISRPG